MIEDFVNFLLTDLHKTPNTADDVIKANRSFFRSERISLDPRLVSECASIPKSHRDTESDFILDKLTASKKLGAPMKIQYLFTCDPKLQKRKWAVLFM